MAAKATALDILSFGEAMVEFNAAGPARDGATYVQGYGGDTSNVVIAAVRQGARAGYLTALGADLFGDALLELWRREGVDTTHVIRRDDAATGIYFVTHDRDGHQFTYYRAGSAASRVTPADVSAAAIAGARILHLSGISQAISESAAATAAEAIAQARAHGDRCDGRPGGYRAAEPRGCAYSHRARGSRRDPRPLSRARGAARRLEAGAGGLPDRHRPGAPPSARPPRPDRRRHGGGRRFRRRLSRAPCHGR